MADLTQTPLDAMLAHRDRMMAEHPEAKTAGELARHMGEHETAYWDWQLGNFFAREGSA